MRILLLAVLCTALLPLAACGHKGKLKSPEQIEQEEKEKNSKKGS